jgi:hypothetical protein
MVNTVAITPAAMAIPAPVILAARRRGTAASARPAASPLIHRVSLSRFPAPVMFIRITIHAAVMML